MSRSPWIDSHCHLPSLTGGAEAALGRARATGIEGFVCVGTDLESSERSVELAAAEPDVWASVGLHPHDASRLRAEWEMLEALSAADPVVAIGETGFDLFYNHSTLDEQERSFRAHIRLAHARGYALVVHTRDAWDDTFRVLIDEGPPARTVLHCFSGGPDEATRALELGAYLSFSGIVSFKNAQALRDAAAIAPPTRVLVETDAPFLAPVPHRGRENEPAFVADVGASLAHAMDVAPDELATITNATTRRVLGLPPRTPGAD